MKHQFPFFKVLLFVATLSVSLQSNTFAQCPTVTGRNGGITLTPGGAFCAPTSYRFDYTVQFLTQPAAANISINFFWNDGTATTTVVLPVGAGQTTFNVTNLLHQFPTDANCEYTVQVIPRISGTFCSAAQVNLKVNSWRRDNVNGGIIQLIDAASGTNIHRVCEGVPISAVFEDRSEWNCNELIDGVANTGLPTDVPLIPNTEARWAQIVYNTPTGGPAKIPNISVNGQPVTGAGGADIIASYLDPRTANGMIHMTAPVIVGDGRRRNTLTITAPGGFGLGFPVVNNEFHVRIRYWNYCNPYDDPNIPGTPVDPVNGDHTPVEGEAIIQIIDAPDAPVVPDRDVCSTESDVLSVDSPLGAGFTYKWWNDPVLRNAANELASGVSSFNPDNTQAPIGNRTHFWVTVESTASGTCRSAATEVKLIKRPALTAPTPISGPTNLCPSGTYTYSVASSPTNITINDLTADPDVILGTEYLWTTPANWTIDSGNGTNTLGVTADATTSGAVTVTRRYTTATSNTTLCAPTTPTSLTVNIRARPTVNISPDPVNLCEGGTVQMNGNPVLPAAATGFTPAVSAHTWGGNTAILDATNVQQPNILTTTSPGAFGLTYAVSVNFGGGVTCTSTTDNSVVNVFATPTTATAGADQDLCQSLATPSAGLGGNTPVTGNGRWTQVSGPGTITFNPNNTTPNATATASAQGIYVVRWTISTGAGLCSSAEDVRLDFGAPPATPDAGPAQDVCANTATLAGTVATFETGTWTVTTPPAGGTVTFSNANSATSTVTLSGAMVYGTYTLRWRFTSGTCTPTEDFVNITFRQAATATGPADFTFCVDNPPTVTIPLSGTFGGGASNAHWELVTGGGTFTSNGTATGSDDTSSPATDSYTPVAADFTAGSVVVRLVTDNPTGACNAVNDPVTITIDRRPANAAAGGDFQTCDPGISLAATPVTNGGTGTWSVGNALYYETFAYTNGVGLSGPNPHAVNFTHPSNNWSITAPNNATLLANDDYLRVQGGVMEAQDVNAELVWRSRSINIAAIPNVTVSIQLAEFGVMEGSDYVRAFYRINGGAEIPFGSIVGESAVNGVFNTFTATGLTGNTIEIVVRILNEAAAEFHRFDNVFVSGSGVTLPFITDVNSPTSAVTGLQVGTTTFTWTVTSALGICSSSMDQVDVIRHASPVNNNITRGLCEDSPGSANTTVTLAYLGTLTNAITGGVANRTLQFFSDAGRSVPFPVSDILADNATVYTRVIRTDVTPNCPTDGTVTIRVNARPQAIDQNPEYCEDNVGGNTKAGINLTLLNNAVKNNVGANTVTWFSSLGPDVPVPDATNVSANDGTSFFARVTDGNGCTNEAEIEIHLNPIPPPNPLLGPTDVCVDPTAVTLYQLTVNNVGYTYTWSIPDPPFDRVIGGTSSDFLVLLSFPFVVNPAQNISVIETSNKGCVGAANVRPIKVDTSPPAITIVDASASSGPGAVCEGAAGVKFSVADLANTTYSWDVPLGSSIIAGQGTFEITVNFGTLGGLISVVPTTTTGCAGNPDDYSVAINPRPSLDILTNTVCSDAEANITLSGTGAATYNITNVSIPPGLSPPSRALVNGALSDVIEDDVFTNTTGGNLTVQYTVVPVSSTGCEGPAQIVNLTIRPEPVLASGLNDEICSTTDAVNVVLSVASGSFPADQYEVFNVVNASGLIPVAGNPTTLGLATSGVLLDDKWRNTTGAVATIEYYIRPRNSVTGCVGDPPIAVLVTVNPEPVLSPIAPEPICSGDSPLTTITPSIPGSTFSWTVTNVTGLITGNTNGSGPSGSAITDVLVNNGTTAGSVTYEIRATGPGGLGSCTGAAQSFTVTVNPAPTANNITQTVCSDAAGGNTVLIDLTTLQNTVHSGGGVTFTWSENATMTPVINTATPYTITGGDDLFVEVDNGQCTKIATVSYTINPLPSITANALQFNGVEITCNGAANGQINATATPDTGTGPYSFNINGGPFFPSGTFNGLAPGSYTIRVRDSKGCIVPSSAIPITQPTPVVASSGTIVNVTCKGSTTGSIQAVAAGGVGAGVPANYTYSINGGAFQPSPLFTGLSAGTYTITVRDANGCTDSEFVTVTEPTLLTGSITAQTNVDCNGNSTASVEVTGAGGVGPYQYSINGGAFQMAPGIFTALAAGSHTVTVRDANNCTVGVPITITQPAILTLTLNTKTDVACNGGSTGSLTVTGSGGTGPYQYDIGAGFQVSGTFPGLAAGPYTITVRDNNNCTTTTGVTINEPLVLQGSITSQTNVACFGGNTGSVTVNGSGGTGTYFYSLNGAGFQASGTYPGLTQGAYTVQVRDANMCTFDVNITITEPTQLTGSAVVTDALCKDTSTGSVIVTGANGTGPYTYSINGGGLFVGSGTFTNLADGNYTVIVRDNNLCTVNVPFTVDEPTLLTVSIQAQTNVDCKGNSTGTVTLQSAGGTGAHEYSIGGAFQLSPTFPGLAAGQYIGKVRDANLCESTVTVTITEPNFLVVSVSSVTNVDCNGNATGSVSVSGAGGTGAYTFSIVPVGNPPGVFAASSTFGTLTAGTYTIYIRDINLCQSQVNATVNQPNALAIALINKVDILCNGQSTGSIAVQASQGTPTYEYSINGSAFTPSNTFTFLAAGSYTIDVRDFNGCETDLTETIAQPTAMNGTIDAPADFNGFDLRCNGLTDGQLVVSASGGVAPYTYLLIQEPGNAAVGNTFNNIREGNYTVRIRDNNNCFFTTPLYHVDQPNPLNIEIDVTSTYNGFDVSCENATDGQVTVTTISGGNTPYSYEINSSPTVFQGSTVFPGLGANTSLMPTYSVKVQDVFGCEKTSLPVVIINPPPFIPGFIGTNQNVCFNEMANTLTQLATPFGGIGNYTYQWQDSVAGGAFVNSAGVSNGPTYTRPMAVTDTVYYRRVVSTGTCASLNTNVVTVTMNPLPEASFTPQGPVCEGLPLILSANFSPGQAPFRFSFTATDKNGVTTVTDRLASSTSPIIVPGFSDTTEFKITALRDFFGCQAVLADLPRDTINVIKINPKFTVLTSPAESCSGGEFEFEMIVDPNVSYNWIWGDGQTQAVGPLAPGDPGLGNQTISHIYESLNTTSNTMYPIIMEASHTLYPGCGVKQHFDQIKIFPNILINLFPNKTEICGGDQITFVNATSGSGTHNWFYREQGVVETRDPRSFNAPSTQAFIFRNTTIQNPITYELVYHVDNGPCEAETIIPITVYREVDANFTVGAVPLFVAPSVMIPFTHTSVPQDATEFSYNWDFGLNSVPGTATGVGPAFNIDYETSGTKVVMLIARNEIAFAAGLTCSDQHTESFTIMLPPLAGGFEFTPLNECFPQDIAVTNNLAGGGDKITYRLVDGTGRQLYETNEAEPIFRIVSPGRYTIFQTIENTGTGQSASASNSGPGNNTLAGTQYQQPINIYPPPFATFEALPKVLFVPDEELRIFNSSISPTDPTNSSLTYPMFYEWDFGDGTIIFDETDPTHFYNNEGNYDIKLIATNRHENGTIICGDTVTQRVTAKAQGFTKIPNAFTPNPSGPNGGIDDGSSPSRNDVFLPVMKGIKEFQMQIFDRWGNLVFESKESNRGWDGYDKNGALLPAGVYVYKLVLRLANDQRTTQIGDVTMIR